MTKQERQVVTEREIEPGKVCVSESEGESKERVGIV